MLIGVLGILLSLFATSIMSYVALATPLGPWIAPTIAFVALLLSRFFVHIPLYHFLYIVSAASIGGIGATALAFSLPTLYFLDPVLFNEWMQHPCFFSALIGIYVLFSGLFGFCIAEKSESVLLNKQDLSFPISQLVFKIISTKNYHKRSYDIVIGFFTTTFYFLIQNFLIPVSLSIQNGLSITPMISAIGFITGHIIAIPLILGLIIRFILHQLHVVFLIDVTETEVMLSFSGGIMIGLLLYAILEIVKQISQLQTYTSFLFYNSVTLFLFSCKQFLYFVPLIISLMLLFTYFSFPWYIQLYILITSCITTYYIAFIAGKIGLALLGRFATFSMIPALFFFNLNNLQLVLIVIFVEMSGGIAADVLFGRKLVQLAGLSRNTMRKYQLLGLVIVSLSVGIIFWYLINHFGLGSVELFAYRAQSRKLLIQMNYFNSILFLLGIVCCFILQKVNCNVMLVFSGILMPYMVSIALLVGGIFSYLSSQREEWYPFCSGVFSSNSLCMVLQALYK